MKPYLFAFVEAALHVFQAQRNLSVHVGFHHRNGDDEIGGGDFVTYLQVLDDFPLGNFHHDGAFGVEVD